MERWGAREPEPSMRDILMFAEVVHGKIDPWHTEAREAFQYVGYPPPPGAPYWPQPGYPLATGADIASTTPVGYGGVYGGYGGGYGYPPLGAPAGYCPQPGYPLAMMGAEANPAKNPISVLPRTPAAAVHTARGAGGARIERAVSTRRAPATDVVGARTPAAEKGTVRPSSARSALRNAERPPWRIPGNSKSDKREEEDTAHASAKARRALSVSRVRPRAAAAPAPAVVQFAADRPPSPPHRAPSTPAAASMPHHPAGSHATHAASLPRYEPSAYSQQPQPQQAGPVSTKAAPGGSYTHDAGGQPIALGYDWLAAAAPTGAVALQFHAFQPHETAQLDPRRYRGLPASAMWSIPAAGVRTRRIDNLHF